MLDFNFALPSTTTLFVPSAFSVTLCRLAIQFCPYNNGMKIQNHSLPQTSPPPSEGDVKFVHDALELARQAKVAGEVPVYAIVVNRGGKGVIGPLDR